MAPAPTASDPAPIHNAFLRLYKKGLALFSRLDSLPGDFGLLTPAALTPPGTFMGPDPAALTLPDIGLVLEVVARAVGPAGLTEPPLIAPVVPIPAGVIFLAADPLLGAILFDADSLNPLILF